MANSHEPLGVNVKGKQIAFKIRHSGTDYYENHKVVPSNTVRLGFGFRHDGCLSPPKRADQNG